MSQESTDTRTDREAYVYAPNHAGNDWATTILGFLADTLRNTAFEWCWATKYTLRWEDEPKKHRIPQKAFQVQVHGVTCARVVKFRYRVQDVSTFETTVEELSKGHGHETGFDTHNLLGDLGKGRYIAAEQLLGDGTEIEERRRQRAEGIAKFLFHGLLLSLDTLVQDGSIWRFENNGDEQNPSSSTFQSILHQICNLTDARTIVVLLTSDGPMQLRVGF